jgi:ribosomal protein L18
MCSERKAIMNASPDHQRFVADHSSSVALAQFLASAGPGADLASLAAAAQAQGYQLTESEIEAAMKQAQNSAKELDDADLDQVVGAHNPTRNYRNPFE